LHNLGLKPSEGKFAYHDDSNDKDEEGHDNLHTAIASTWNTPEGEKISKQWSEDHNVHVGEEIDLMEVLQGGLQMIQHMANRHRDGM